MNINVNVSEYFVLHKFYGIKHIFTKQLSLLLKVIYLTKKMFFNLFIYIFISFFLGK